MVPLLELLEEAESGNKSAGDSEGMAWRALPLGQLLGVLSASTRPSVCTSGDSAGSSHTHGPPKVTNDRCPEVSTQGV